MRLYIVRHAWAGEAGDPAYPDDDQRPLTPDGKKRFEKLVRRLTDAGFNPHCVATSPLVRCLQTAEVIHKLLSPAPTIVPLNALKPGSDIEGLIRWTEQQAAEQVAWVGHAPDVGELTAALIGDARAEIRFSKGAVAAIDVHDPLHPGCGTLRWLVTAKLLGC